MTKILHPPRVTDAFHLHCYPISSITILRALRRSPVKRIPTWAHPNSNLCHLPHLAKNLTMRCLTKTPTRSVVNEQIENEKTPTQTSVLNYRLSSKEDAEKSTSFSRKLFIIPLTADNHESLTDDLDLEERSEKSIRIGHSS